MIERPKYKIVHSLNGLGMNRYTPMVKFTWQKDYEPLATKQQGALWYATQQQAKVAIDKHLEQYLGGIDEYVDEIPYIPTLTAKDPCVPQENFNG